MDIEGMIIQDLGEVGGTSRAGNPWRKHEWVMETLGQYPRKVKFDVFGDRCDTLKFELGKSYVVMVDPESREFNGRWYTDLRAFNSRPSENSNTTTPPGQMPPFTNTATVSETPTPNPFPKKEEFLESESGDDLPF